MVGLLRKGNKVRPAHEPSRACCCSNPLPHPDETSRWKMSHYDPVVTIDSFRRDAFLAIRSSRSRRQPAPLADRETNLPETGGDICDLLGVFLIGNQTFFPHWIRDYDHSVAAKQPSDGKNIGFAGRFVHEIGSGNMDQVVLQQLQCARTVDRFNDEFAALRLKPLGEYRDTGITSGNQQSGNVFPSFVEDADRRRNDLSCAG